MSEKKSSNLLVRIWRGFWNGLTAFRMAVFNILFLIVLALILRAIFFSGDAIMVEADSTLVLNPNGLIVEEYTGTPTERALNEALGQQLPETRLRDLLRTLELAAEDDNIAQVLIRTDSLQGMSPGTMTELSAAFDRFRESGKPVVAYASFITHSQYGLAALADEIWLHPDGIMLLEGFSYFRNYYREGLEKLEVDVNLFRVGEFKSAMEPFIRDDMSEAAREAGEFFVGDLWQQYLTMIARHRGMPVERLTSIINNQVELVEQADGNVAEAMLEAGLIDRLVSRPQARLELAETGAPDEDTVFVQIDMDSYLQVPRAPAIGQDEVAIIVASGSIVEGNQSPGMIGADSTARLIRNAADDDDIRAVVLRVDSGGGSAFASEVIRQELLALKETGKPVVVSMGDVAASGGYWIAMGADEVWAYPNTITGSIGIFGFFPTFQNTLAKIGVNTDGFGTTPLSGMFRSDMAMSEAAQRAFQSVIENGYQEFIGLVAEYRDMSFDAVDTVAQGRVWTGNQALERSLVDQIGTLQEAAAAAARIAGLGEDFSTVYVQQELSSFEQFLADMGSAALAQAGLEFEPPMLVRWMGRDLYLGMLEQLNQIAAAGQPKSGLPDVMAHCLCEPPL
ncbi:MAG: signal peptide peptidase SppA [Pseudomonadota bacterium]